MRLPCAVCSSIDPTEVTWCYNQTEISTSELNITAEATWTRNKFTKNTNCGDLKLYWYEFKFETDSQYSCHIITPLELSEHCTVDSTRNNATVCDNGLPACTYGQSQTDSQCVAQITTTPVLPSATLSAQSDSTGLAGASSEPTPSVPSSTASPSIAPAGTASEPTPSVSSSTNGTGCTLGRVSCYIVYPAVGLGALTAMVVLLVVVIIVLVCISVKRGKKKMQSERECILLCVVVTKASCMINIFLCFICQGTEKAPEVELHTYDVVVQPVGGETVPNDQQHIYHRTQHTNIVDKTQQTCDEYHQENTTTQEYEHPHNARQRSRREEARSRKHDYEQVSTGEQNESETLSSHVRVLEGQIEVSSIRPLTTTTADMYSTPNFSLKETPQSPGSQDHFYHVLEGPTPPISTNTYSSADRSTAPGKKEDDNDYDEPVLLTGNKAGHQLFDDPKYQSTFAPVMSTQSDTFTNRAKIKLLPNLACASPVEEAAISDSSFQASAVTSPANPTEGKWNDMHAFCKDAQEDDYNQPTVITVKNKDLINERGDQPVLFDDPTYQIAQSAPV